MLCELRPQVCHNQIQHENEPARELLFREVRAHRGERCLRAIARKISHRAAVVIAYSRSPRKYRRAAVRAHISFLFHLSQTFFFAFFISRVMDRLVSHLISKQIAHVDEFNYFEIDRDNLCLSIGYFFRL